MTLVFAGLIILYAALIVLFYGFSNWRGALLSILLLVVFEGALRKWVLPQARELLYFAKDGTLVIVVLATLLPHKGVRVKGYLPETLKLLLGLNALWGLIQVFNPALGSPLVGLLGLRAYFLYIPLMWLTPYLFADQAAFVRFLRLYLLLTIPLGVLGIVQYFSPITSPLNQYILGETSSIAAVGQNARITSTFSYIAGYAAYLIVTFCLLISLVFSPQPRLWTIVTLLEFALVIVNSLMTGSRGVIFSQVLILVGFLALQIMTRPEASLRRFARLALPLSVLFVVTIYFFGIAYENFIWRATVSKDASERIVASWTQPFDFVQLTGLSGYGIGATQAGGQMLARALDASPGETIPVYFESEMGRVMLELGPFGYGLWYGLRIYLALLHWRTFCRLRTPLLRSLALVAFLFSIVQIDGQLVTNPTMIVYYWFINSFILLLPRLEWQAQTPQSLIAASIYDIKTRNTYPSYRQPQLS